MAEQALKYTESQERRRLLDQAKADGFWLKHDNHYHKYLPVLGDDGGPIVDETGELLTSKVFDYGELIVTNDPQRVPVPAFDWPSAWAAADTPAKKLALVAKRLGFTL